MTTSEIKVSALDVLRTVPNAAAIILVTRTGQGKEVAVDAAADYYVTPEALNELLSRYLADGGAQVAD